MFIKAHIFESEKEALESIKTINKGEGIPISETAVTRTYTKAQQYENIWYIHADKITEKYLGKSEDLELIFEEEQ